MIGAEAFQFRLRRDFPYRGMLWAAIAVAAYLLAYSLASTNAGTAFGDWPRQWELPIQEPIDNIFDWIGDTFAWFFNPVSDVIDAGIAGIDTFLLWLPWPVVVAAVSMLGLSLGGKWLGLFSGAGTLFIGLNGYWDSAIVTLSVVGVSVIIAVGIGVPTGILAAFSNRFESVVRPILDTMQVLPAFVYLIPAVILFGVSGTQGVFLTVVYSIPPVIRLTNLGIRQVPRAAIETAQSHGSTTTQTLFQVQLPLAKSSIMMGINQTIMMAVSMVIITALVGVEGLGRDVWLSLRKVDAGEGLESGIAIVLLAIILDRFSYAMVQTGPTSSAAARNISPLNKMTAGQSLQRLAARYFFPIASIFLLAILLVAGVLVGSLRVFPDELTFTMAEHVNRVVDWMAVNLHFITSWLRDTLFRDLGYSPIHTLLLWLPWPALMILATGLAYFTAGWRAAILALGGLGLAGIGGVWDVTMDTLSQVLTAGGIHSGGGYCTGRSLIPEQGPRVVPAAHPRHNADNADIRLSNSGHNAVGRRASGRHHSYRGLRAASRDPHDHPRHQRGTVPCDRNGTVSRLNRPPDDAPGQDSPGLPDDHVGRKSDPHHGSGHGDHCRTSGRRRPGAGGVHKLHLAQDGPRPGCRDDDSLHGHGARPHDPGQARRGHAFRSSEVTDMPHGAAFGRAMLG